MIKSPSYFTVVGYADMDELVTFTEVVFAPYEDAWAVAVEQAMAGDPKRDFITQATEISTFVGICTERHGRITAPVELSETLKLDPAKDDLYDLQIYRRTEPGEVTEAKPNPAPVVVFYWFDDTDETENGPFDTYGDALDNRYEHA